MRLLLILMAAMVSASALSVGSQQVGPNVVPRSPMIIKETDLSIGVDGAGNLMPDCLDRLAADLRDAVGADPAVRARMARSRVAVSTFELIGIDPPSVAKNAAEDLYTAMIRSEFELVERGQLDAVLRELKVQDTALIDPATAQKIGRLSGCDVILLGSISNRESRIVVNARLMETATGKSIAAARLEVAKPVPAHQTEVGQPVSAKREARGDDRWVVTMRASARH